VEQEWKGYHGAVRSGGIAVDTGNHGDCDKAIADHTEAIRLDPKYAEAYYGRSLAYSKKGEKAKEDVDLAQAKRLGYKGD
jgi:Flp pilus assembly protein TadD